MTETNLQENGSKRPTQLVLVVNITLAAETQEALVGALAAAARPGVRPVTAVGSPVAQVEDPWLGLGDAAQHLGVSSSTLYKYASQGKIESRKLAGRLQFRRSLLDRFMAEQVRPARPGARLRSIIPAALGSGK
jgi:excisionase family DNA binding protein